MNNECKNKLMDLLLSSGFNDIAESLANDSTDCLPPNKQDILLRLANKVRRELVEIKFDMGMAGPSPKAGGRGYRSDDSGGI